jgi:putative DNA primase/helicase
MTIQQIHDWLGEPLFLIPQHPGTKVPMVKYTQETPESTLRPVYQALLENGNTAVRLGEHSGGFCAIDFDDDGSLQQFLAVNPGLQTSARWKGSRGAQIGVRILGDYPPPSAARSSTDMVEVNDRTLGRPLYEWRSTGNLSTVRGLHPSGCQYQVLVPNPPARIKFTDIRWPDGWPVPGARDPIEELTTQCGEPWRFGKGGGRLLAPFWAGLFLQREEVLWDTVTGQFFLYHADRGIWVQEYRQEVGQQIQGMVTSVLGKHILEGNGDAKTRISSLLPAVTAAFIESVLALLEHLCVRRDPFVRPESVVHTQTSMVDLRVQPYVRHPFGKKWMSRNQCPVRFDPDGSCPQWQAFLDHALPDIDDQRMLQHWGGLALMQRNLFSVFLLLTGTGGGGKSTVAGVIRGLVGEENCAELRTQHLGSRFEASTFHDKTLLLGSDVAPDFLSCDEAGFIKSLTGGDRITVEFKGRNDRKQMTGEWNVLVTANTRLRVNVQGDLGAWARRLLLIDFNQPKPATVIHNYHIVMLREEGSGILNWFLEGARLLMTADAGGCFPMTQRQRQRIGNLLSESDSVRFFIVNHVRRSSLSIDNVTSEELFTGYRQMCAAKDWASEPQRRFQMRAADLMLEVHQAMPSKHLNRANRDDSGCRGYRNVRLVAVDAIEEGVDEPF